jgi:acyl carrier protein
MDDTRVKIREFLSKFIQTNELEDDTDIFAAGFVNSLFAMQLVLFVESQFGIRVERQDLRPDNFRSINALANLVKRKEASKSRV